MSMTTTEKKTKRVKKASMEDTIKKLVELAQAYASYAKKSIIGMDDYISFRGEHIYARVNFVDDVWFVSLGDVEVTTNANKITFPYSYTLDDLVKTCTLYTGYLDKLNTEAMLSGKTHDTPKCELCGERTALVKGTFYYSPNEEPYNSGVEEDSEVEGGECWVGGFKCDDCGHIQGLWNE